MTTNQPLSPMNNQMAYDSLLATIEHLGQTCKPKCSEPSKTLIMDFMPSPLGSMCLAADQDALYLLEFVDRKNIAKELEDLLKKCNAVIEYGENHITRQSKTQLEEYFSGTRQTFDIPTHMLGTDFQISVWQSLLTIPYGETISYAEQAKYLKRDKAVRAVANSNGMNRMAIIYPCHRVIGSNGKLTGYAGKIERKAWLLAHEKQHI
ncbi:methylated-DNA--[protein]-cysteine S-methyltransferase [Cardiobacteriaceae bacterium TAE3-ERU3]|nr:methylated-DNA--[protein]-cysteine S-methyltransferase [Cardiobacteriaceae bacterium TAE3-ERU3]